MLLDIIICVHKTKWYKSFVALNCSLNTRVDVFLRASQPRRSSQCTFRVKSRLWPIAPRKMRYYKYTASNKRIGFEVNIDFWHVDVRRLCSQPLYVEWKLQITRERANRQSERKKKDREGEREGGREGSGKERQEEGCCCHRRGFM